MGLTDSPWNGELVAEIAPAETRVLEVNQTERILILNLLSTQWDVANEERMKTEPNSMDELWFLERQSLIEGLQRKLV
jgi:hypothetical protein